MIFHPAPLPGAFVIDVEPVADERGSFARTFSADAFVAHGLAPVFVESSLSHNRARMTLRGLHYQAPPYEEDKLVSCVSGSIYDVIVDLRPTSPTFGKAFSAVLEASFHRAIYVPKGFAHGYLTLDDHTIVSYHMTERYRPEAARGVRFDDPALAIDWPALDPIVSPRDRALPRLSEICS